MNEVVLLGLINLGLIGWIYALHKKHERTILMLHSLFEGIYHKKVEIVKFNELYVPRPIE